MPRCSCPSCHNIGVNKYAVRRRGGSDRDDGERKQQPECAQADAVSDFHQSVHQGTVYVKDAFHMLPSPKCCVVFE